MPRPTWTKLQPHLQYSIASKTSLHSAGKPPSPTPPQWRRTTGHNPPLRSIQRAFRPTNLEQPTTHSSQSSQTIAPPSRTSHRGLSNALPNQRSISTEDHNHSQSKRHQRSPKFYALACRLTRPLNHHCEHPVVAKQGIRRQSSSFS